MVGAAILSRSTLAAFWADCGISIRQKLVVIEQRRIDLPAVFDGLSYVIFMEWIPIPALLGAAERISSSSTIL